MPMEAGANVSLAGVMASNGQPTARVRFTLPVTFEESVAVTVMGKFPAEVGVPESTAFLNVTPDGSAPVSLNTYPPDPPIAEKDCEKAVLMPSAGRVAGLIWIGVPPWPVPVMETICW